MPQTLGINHLGLAVADLDDTTCFFVEVLGWQESGRDLDYPRTSVSDGCVRLTLWQVDKSLPTRVFDRRHNIGLHHLALAVDTYERIVALAQVIASHPGVSIEFMPEMIGDGPRMHVIFQEPGGIRLELIWPGV